MELERKEIELEIEERRRMEIKKNLINDAAKKQDEPVDDSKLVEAMFDFLPDSSSEAPAPTRETSVFMVNIFYNHNYNIQPFCKLVEAMFFSCHNEKDLNLYGNQLISCLPTGPTCLKTRPTGDNQSHADSIRR